VAAVNAVAAYRQFLIDSGGTAPMSKSLTTPPASAVENASTIIPSKSRSPRIAASAPSIPNKNVPARSATSRPLPASYFMAREPNKSRKNGAADSQAFMTPLRVFAAARRHKSWATILGHNPGPQSWATILGWNGQGFERVLTAPESSPTIRHHNATRAKE